MTIKEKAEDRRRGVVLSNVNKIVETHSGVIEAERRINGVASFRILLLMR